jgi:two-component sensor histidine kinase
MTAGVTTSTAEGRETEDLRGSGMLSPERLEALRSTGLLDTAPEEPFDRLTQLVCRVLRVPVSLVSLVDADRQFFKSQQGLPEPWAETRETPLSHSFCQHVVLRREPLIVEDARSDPRVCDNLAIPEIGVAGYLGVPLTTPDGHILGSLCAIDIKARAWSDDDLLTLQDIARAVMGEIALRAEIVRRRESEEQLALLSQELTHRIKNIFAVTSSLIALSAKSGGTADELVATIRKRLGALSRAHDYVTPEQPNTSRIEGPKLGGLMVSLLAAYPQGQIEVTDCDQIIGAKCAAALALVFHETATNAVKYGALSTVDGRITVTCHHEDHAITICWEESGGPAIEAEPERRGFGSVLAERIARTQLDAVVEREWKQDGLKLRMRVPSERLIT